VRNAIDPRNESARTDQITRVASHQQLYASAFEVGRRFFLRAGIRAQRLFDTHHLRSPVMTLTKEYPTRSTRTKPARSRKRNGASGSTQAVLSLVELSQGLTVSDDIYRAVDVLLQNLMGCLATSRAALWLVADESAHPPVLIRSRGLPGEEAEAVSDGCAVDLLAAVRTASMPLQGEALESSLDAPPAALLRAAQLAILAPIQVGGATIGVVALGARADGSEYETLELQLLQASLGIAGIAFQNGAIHNRLLETSRRLRIANEELKQMDRMRFEFLANVNHELRTPLSVIVPALECVTETDLDAAEMKPFLEDSAAQARKLVGLVENLLTLSELARDALSLHVVEQDLVSILTSYHAERLPGIRAGLRQFELSVPPDAIWVRFDELRLRQALDALVDNAVKFTPCGSRIKLAVDGHVENRVPWVRVRVEDNGPGIPSEQLPHLFEPFWQLDASLTRKFGGLGIGLALARDLVERMGGRITVSSELSRGCTFSILLPARHPTPAQAE
jgi:signal transduction histidine kinase